MTVAKIRPWASGDRVGNRLFLWCPGCEDVHAVEVTDPAYKWDWDGNLEAPTISPSIKVDYPERVSSPSIEVTFPANRGICHSYVKAGRWQFLGDCTHDLAGQTVPLPDLPDWILL